MLFFYILISLFIAWIWIDYYRLIDVYEKEKLPYIILTFALGATSVLLVDLAYYLFLSKVNFDFNGNALNDFLVSTFKIGLLEELCKTVPFLLVLLIFKKNFNEPIDFIAFISIAALGFSATENVMYFYKHGSQIIDGRAILSSVGHMFDTSLIAYGIVLYKYKQHSWGIFIVFVFLLLAALSHGIYDFWLLFEPVKDYGWLITIVYFLFTISIFAVIINNSLNNSSFFTYKKVVDSGKVFTRLLSYYGIVMLFQLVFVSIEKDFHTALFGFLFSIWTTILVILVTVTRLSRFKLIRNRWFKIKLELPFEYYYAYDYGGRGSRGRLAIKGEAYNDIHITAFYEEQAILNPVSARNSYFGVSKRIFIKKKLFLKNDEAYYLSKIYHGPGTLDFELYLLKPRTANITLVKDKYPIVAVLQVIDLNDLENPGSDHSKFRFLEWAYLRPENNE